MTSIFYKQGAYFIIFPGWLFCLKRSWQPVEPEREGSCERVDLFKQELPLYERSPPTWNNNPWQWLGYLSQRQRGATEVEWILEQSHARWDNVEPKKCLGSWSIFSWQVNSEVLYKDGLSCLHTFCFYSMITSPVWVFPTLSLYQKLLQKLLFTTTLSALPSSYLNLSVCLVGNRYRWSVVKPVWLPSPTNESQSLQKWEAWKIWQGKVSSREVKKTQRWFVP